MSITVGLDFGTHQTKICIEDASNPAQKIYEFLEFTDLAGESTVLYPSIVQINNDDTVSYGFVDETRCKIMYDEVDLPMLILPIEPRLVLPEKPVKKTYPSKPPKPIFRSLLNLFGIESNDLLTFNQWEYACRNIDHEFSVSINAWQLECEKKTEEYNLIHKQYENEKNTLTKEYNAAAEGKGYITKKMLFRYFKLASFYKEKWEYTIKPEIISVWYLTNILFKLQKKYGSNFYTQMGIPSSLTDIHSLEQKRTAFKILIASYHLIEFYKEPEKFQNTRYTELLEQTNLSDYLPEELINYGLNVVPEAYAGLLSVTQQRKLDRGMHLFADIGGGTTDIAFFTITEARLPDIHYVLSIPQGLNYIFEEYHKTNSSLSISQLQDLFRETKSEFTNSISLYHNNLIHITGKMIQRIENEFLKRSKFHGFRLMNLRNAIKNQTVVYCGGGSIYDIMRIPLKCFTDVKLINKDYVNIPYVKNSNIEHTLFTILATSFGLSIPQEEECKMTRIEEVFAHLPKKEPEEQRYQAYEHGLTDL